jgi:hypothetical protein
MSSANNSIFYFQFVISLIALGFSITMLVVQKENNNIYLPFLTSLVFAWIPSPINTQTQNQNTIENSSQEIEEIDKEIESQKLLLKNNKTRIYNINKNLEEEKDEEKEIELKTIHIDENSFIPIVLRKDI